MALIVFVCAFAVQPAAAETRSLKLYFLHTGEKAEITFKRNGKYVSGGLKKINRFLRDWRRNEPTKMDPRLLDLIWEVYQETGSRKHIHVISAYRSPATNKLLRKRGRGVARKSQHTLGKALDFFIPGVSLRKLRNIGLKKGLGGVGYYPKSGSPFVHMDTGRVRHWPRMSRKELARVFPQGKTLHVPTDGKPLARYNQAKADYERKVKGRDRIVVAKAEDIRKKPNVFARLLGRAEEEDGATGVVAAPRPVVTQRQPAPAPSPAVAAAPAPQPAIAGTPSLPAPTAVPAPGAPVPAEGLSPPQPEVASPATLLASLPPSAIPVPASSPRTLALNTTPEELPETPETVVEGDAVEAIELALAVPTPAQRPEPETQPEATGVQVAALAPEPGQRAGALSPTEIEDLRQQVYATLRSDLTRPAPEPDPEPGNGNLQIASAETEALETTTAARGIVVPSPNPRASQSETADTEVAVAPLEPGTRTTGTIAIPGLNPVERPAPDSTEIAQLEPLEPGTRTSETISVPSPNPAQEDDAPSTEGTVVAGIAIPSAAVRENTASDTRSQPQTTLASATQTTPDNTLSLEQFRTANLDKRLIGKWALSADASIKDIADIQPPAYGRNIIRELPQTVLSRGFSQENVASFTNGFSGSSIEFLDFKRFQ